MASTMPTSSRCSRGRRSEFDDRLRGSAIRRIGYERWLRNLAVGLGNADYDERMSSRRCTTRRDDPSLLVREHVAWALAEHSAKALAARLMPSAR